MNRGCQPRGWNMWVKLVIRFADCPGNRMPASLTRMWRVLPISFTLASVASVESGTKCDAGPTVPVATKPKKPSAHSPITSLSHPSSPLAHSRKNPEKTNSKNEPHDPAITTATSSSTKLDDGTAPISDLPPAAMEVDDTSKQKSKNQCIS